MTENEQSAAETTPPATATQDKQASRAGSQAPTPNPEPVEGPRDPAYTGDDAKTAATDNGQDQEESQ